MVMATASLYHPYDTGDMSLEVGRDGAARREAAALHERLVAYVHALAPPHEARSGVWVEHSYARARVASHAPASHVRVLLAPRSDPPSDIVDVERDDAPPPGPPSGLSSPSPRASRETSPDDEGVEADEEWESRVTALAPSAAHAALAELALDALRRLRLARLAGGRAVEAEHLRGAARRLRHALAGAALAPGAPSQRPAPWLHATLSAYAPRASRRLYDALLGELARAAPRLAARLAGGRVAPRRDPLGRLGPALSASEPGPWLVWVCEGSRRSRRWARRLGALVRLRSLAAGPSQGPAPPEAWCAAVAGSVRAALVDVLAEAGDRAVILGGFGAGASLCAALAAGLAPPSVRGLLLLALPLLSAEGPRDAPDDPLAELRLPLLLVAGTGAAACPLGALRGLVRPREPPQPARRLLEVRGADDSLRLPAALRHSRRLPQHALDAAVAEECARWALETAEGPAAGPRPSRRRAPEPQEYAHLPAAVARAPTLESARVVSRGSGATPLALLPPRRPAPAPSPAPAPAPAPPPLAAADIMRLPIVFADDEPPVTVTSGRYARVVVASRARPLLLRRALRFVPRADHNE